MMAYEGSESAQDNFGIFINRFQLETKTLVRKLKNILIIQTYVYLLFNETCLNKLLLPKTQTHTDTETHTHTHIYVYIYIGSWQGTCA